MSIRTKPTIWDPHYPNRRAAGVQLFADNGTLCFIKWEHVTEAADALIDALERYEKARNHK